MPAAKVQTSGISAFQGNSTSVVAGTATGYQRTLTFTGGNTGIARLGVRNITGVAGLITGLTDNRGQTWTLRASERDTLEDGFNWIYLFECLNVAAGSTTVSIDFTQEDTNNICVWELSEFSGILTAAAHDVGDTTTVLATANSISAGPTATLAQADSIYIGLVAGKWWYFLNDPSAPPSGWTLDAGAYDNTFLAFQSVHKVVAATTGLTATWAVPAGESANEAGSAFIFAYKAAAAGSLRVRALYNTAINGDTAIAALVWTGDPTTTYARLISGLTAEASGGVLLIPLPSGQGYTAGQSVNVYAYNAVDDSGIITATVEAY